MDSVSGESLRPSLQEAKRVLEQALDSTCAVDLDEADTAEMIRIEEALAFAAKAAKDVVSLRLRRRARLGSQGTSGKQLDAPDHVASHRVFEDFSGSRWHAFAVYPEDANSEPTALPEAYQKGWLAFRSEQEVRRVAPLPSNWNELSIDELRELCHKAAVAPKKAPLHQGQTSTSDQTLES